MFFGQVNVWLYIGKLFFKVELKLVPTRIRDQHKQLGMEALNIVEDTIQDMCTCARNLGCNQLKIVMCISVMDYAGPFLLTCVAIYRVKLCESSVLHMTSRGLCTVGAQSKSNFMLVLCSRQIPAKVNKLILTYLILLDSTR